EKLNKNPVPAEIPLIASQSDLLRHLFSAGIKSDVQHPLYQTARHALEVERRRNSECAYDEYDGVLGIKVDIARRRWSATRLTEYGQCPFKWFA
ncbi:PD-(D/E)XK nuclease family protein, partial [Escherichia coli]|nr:PD-(D/E)XK nuclease family protein [Escherichia coli]